MNWNSPDIRSLVRSALREDDYHRDVTTRLLVNPSWRIKAQLIVKEPGVIAGLPLARILLKAVDPNISFNPLAKDGDAVRPGCVVAKMAGPARSLLTGERPALNALRHLSGIATYTATQLRAIRGTGVQLCDTRKTLPGWRALQKYAVRCGGGTNHRMSLGDAILIKENHLEIARKAENDWVLKLKRWRKGHRRLLQLEIQSPRDLEDALRLRPDRVLLDNLPIPMLKRMIRLLRRKAPGIEIEITGNVSPKTLPALARLRPDRISMGRLTHSAPAFDISLDVTDVYSR